MEEKKISNELALMDKQCEMMRRKAAAEFAMTPMGQMIEHNKAMEQMGRMYSQSTLVPDIYKSVVVKRDRQGNVTSRVENPNALANCAIAIDMASRMKANPLMVMQNLYIVGGNPGWSSKFLIATINTCGRFQPLRYECNNLKGDDYGWRCYTYDIDDKEKKERLEGSWITWKMVKAEGWDTKSGSKWQTMPEQMFRYRAAAFWQRQYAPEISMGFSTAEEVAETAVSREIEDTTYEDITPIVSADTAKERLRASAAVRQEKASDWIDDAFEYQKQKAMETEKRFGADPETGEVIDEEEAQA